MFPENFIEWMEEVNRRLRDLEAEIKDITEEK